MLLNKLYCSLFIFQKEGEVHDQIYKNNFINSVAIDSHSPASEIQR